MRLIVDTNRTIAALIKDSFSRKIINHLQAELISINFSLQEVEKHKLELVEKMEVSFPEFALLLDKLKSNLIILDDKVVQQNMEEAKRIMDIIDPDDTPFIAAALATKADIWSDDPHFQQQKKVKVWKTKDLTKLMS